MILKNLPEPWEDGSSLWKVILVIETREAGSVVIKSLVKGKRLAFGMLGPSTTRILDTPSKIDQLGQSNALFIRLTREAL
jgi:hypothetical protein